MNFKHDVACQKMKRGILISELRRAVVKNSTEGGKKSDFEKIKMKYENLDYPEKLVEEAILKVESPTNPNERDWLTEKSENPERNHILKLPFTNFRVSKISKNIRKTLQKLTPLFNLQIVHRLITNRNIIIKNLVPTQDPLKSIDSIYYFKCACPSSYVGETEREVQARIGEHGRIGPIYEHIIECAKYQEELRKAVPISTTHTRLKFLKSHFRVLHTGVAYHERKTSEAFEIRFRRPDLKIQVKRKKVSFT
jgi:hypothetical protein